MRDGAFKGKWQVAAAMDAYRVEGTVPMGKVRQQFTLDVIAADTADAEHRVYSIIGSRHKAKRRKIEINSCDKIDPRESREAQVIDYFREQLATMEPLPTKESPAQEALPKEEE
ncbi:MAG: hypothetical protein CXX80_01000 [Methanobacteriota archaeon]|nr:MAG: hypothetical protein CXX80_04935 [Euryarchaeota archaeon]PXY77307.1 MAG: hypothetical protein CXX80_01000 [Euryarchaeota archaeon]HIA39932.1 hypothetical protein [Candidatus Poseidoniales archaeon]